jgi:hypothetical protein
VLLLVLGAVVYSLQALTFDVAFIADPLGPKSRATAARDCARGNCALHPASG